MEIRSDNALSPSRKKWISGLENPQTGARITIYTWFRARSIFAALTGGFVKENAIDDKIKGKSSIYEVHQFSSLVISSSPEIENRSERSILAMREYKHFQQKHLEFFKPVS